MPDHADLLVKGLTERSDSVDLQKW